MSNARRLYPPIAALCAFEAVARNGSFTLAAAELALTQSAVSRRVQALDEQLDYQLLARGTRSLELTPAGEAFLEEVAPALMRIRVASLNAITHNRDRDVTIALLPTFGTRWLMPRIPAFTARHPDAMLNLVTRIGRIDFAHEQIDDAIYYGPADWPEAELTELLPEKIGQVAAPAFLEDNPIRTPEDVLSAPKLLMRSRPHDWQDWLAAQELPTEFRRGTIFEQFSMVAEACAAGLGIALMPDFLIAPELEPGSLTRVGPKIASRGAYHFATPKGTTPSPVVSLFRDWVAAEAAAYRASSSPD